MIWWKYKIVWLMTEPLFQLLYNSKLNESKMRHDKISAK